MQHLLVAKDVSDLCGNASGVETRPALPLTANVLTIMERVAELKAGFRAR